MKQFRLAFCVLMGTLILSLPSHSSWALPLQKQTAAVYAAQRQHSEQFVKGSDGYLHYHYHHAGKWRTDKLSFRRGGKVSGAIAAIYSPHQRHSAVVFRGSGGYLHHYYVGSSRSWQFKKLMIAGKVTGDLSAVYEPQRKAMGVFFRGQNGFLRYLYFHAGKWRVDKNTFRRAGKVSGNISAIFSHKDNHSAVVFRGASGYLHHFHIKKNHGWQFKTLKFAGKVTGALSAVYEPQRKAMGVFFRGAQGFLRYAFVHRGKWMVDKASFRRGGKVNGTVSAVFASQRNHSEVFYRGTDGKVRYFFIYKGWSLDSKTFRRGTNVDGVISAVYSPKHRHSEFYYKGANQSRQFFYLKRGWQLHSWLPKKSPSQKIGPPKAGPPKGKKIKSDSNSHVARLIGYIYSKVPLLRKLIRISEPKLTITGSAGRLQKSVLKGRITLMMPSVGSPIENVINPVKKFPMEFTVTFQRKLKIEYDSDSMISELKNSRTNQFEFKAVSRAVWDKPFHIPFLKIKDVGFQVKFNPNKKKFEFILLGSTQVGEAVFPGKMYLKLEGDTTKKTKEDKIRERRNKAIMDRRRKKGVERRRKKSKSRWKGVRLTDISLSLPNGIDFSKLPGLKHAPFVNEFAFRKIRLALTEFTASVIWKRFNFRADAVLMIPGLVRRIFKRGKKKSKSGKKKKKGGDWLLALRLQGISLGMLMHEIPKPLSQLKFPSLAIVISSKDRHDDQVSKFPPMTRKLFRGIAKPSDFIPIQSGVNIFTIFNTSMLPKGSIIRRGLENEFGLKNSSMLLTGALGSLKLKAAKFTLAAMLPGFRLPYPVGKFIGVSQSSLFFRMDLTKQIVQVGVGGGIRVNMPRLDNPDKLDPLNLTGDIYFQTETGKYGLRVVGNVKGTWREPLGIGNIELSDPAILVGYGSGNNVAIGVGGTTRIKNSKGKWETYSADFLINAIIAKVPIVNKLGFRLKAAKLSPVMGVEIANSLFRGVFLGPMSKLIVKSLPPKSRTIARKLQRHLYKRSMQNIMELDKIPLPLVELRDVDLYFATPNAIIPGREKTMKGMGIGIAGKAQIRFMGQIYKLGGIKSFLTVAHGLILKGNLEPRKLGVPPFQYNLKAAKLDIKASFDALPHFKVHGDLVDPFGSKGEIDVELSERRAKFLAHLNIEKIFKLYVKAQTIGSSIFTATDFTFDAHTKDTLDSFVRKLVIPNLKEPFRGMVRELTKVARNVLPIVFKEIRVKGSLRKFVLGKQPATVYINHTIHGKRVQPISMKIKPVWKAKKREELLTSLLPLHVLTERLVNSYMHNSPIGPGKPFQGKMLVNRATGKCLQAGGKNQLLTLASCNDRNSSQRWNFNKLNRWQLVSTRKLCADAQGTGIMQPQRKLQSWSCHAGTNQKWKVKGEQIQSMTGVLCWEVAGNKVVLAYCNDKRRFQRWQVVQSAKGTKAIKKKVLPATKHKICLRTKKTGKYVGVTTLGHSVMAKADACLSWESFSVVLSKKDLLRSWKTVAIHGHKGYWAAQQDGGLKALSGSVREWERFRFYKIGAKPGTVIKDGDVVAIYSTHHKRWLKFHKGGGDYVRADSKHPKEWQQFIITFQ